MKEEKKKEGKERRRKDRKEDRKKEGNLSSDILILNQFPLYLCVFFQTTV